MFIFFLSFYFLFDPFPFFFFQKSYLGINIVNISVRVIETGILCFYINKKRGNVKKVMKQHFFLRSILCEVFKVILKRC